MTACTYSTFWYYMHVQCTTDYSFYCFRETMVSLAQEEILVLQDQMEQT